jgi:hypothetical protein
MLKRVFCSVAIVLFAISVTAAQVDTTKPVTVAGTVKSIDGDKLVLDTAKGETTIAVAATAAVKKVSAANPSLSAAVASAFAEIVAGDRVVLTALPMADGKLNPARTVLIISKADIASRDKSNAEAWRTRGVAGVVESVNPETKQITVKVSGPMGASTNIVVTPKADAKVLKYAPDSNRFADAKPSSVETIAKDDSIQALGDKSEDGTSLTAEVILTGSYRQVLGTVKSVDAANGEVVVTERGTNKDVTISLANATMMKRLPQEFAERMSGAGRPAGQGAPGGQPGAGAPPAGGAPGQGPAGPRPGGMGPRGNFNDLLERFPTVTVAQLVPGEMIGVVAAKDAGATKVKAFKMLAGIEPFVRMAEMRAQAGGQQRGSQVALQIPGLDGFSMP